MYGTIAHLKLKPGIDLSENLKRQMESALTTNGLIGSYLYHSDNDPNEAWLVVMFESREAYHANAQSEEQNERFVDMMRYMAAEPEWHDGEIIWFADQRVS